MNPLRRRLRLLTRRAKRRLEAWTYDCFDRLALRRAPPAPRPATAAVVHVERIGDYVLWRAHGQALVAWLASRGQRVVLVVDASVGELAREDFPDCDVVELARRRMLREPRYRWRLLRALRAHAPSHAYVPSCPRDSVVHDAVVRALGAPATGFDAGFTDDPVAGRAAARSLYTTLVRPLPGGAHMDDQHRAFLAAVGAPAAKPVALRPPRPAQAGPEMRYWVLAPGSSQDGKCWPAERFVEVANDLAAQPGPMTCVLLGSADERALCELIGAGLRLPYVNLAGCTSVALMQQWIAHAEFLLGNDSAAGHFAAALGVPAVIVTGGGQHGRCYPYNGRHSPARLRPLAVSVSPPMPCFHCDWICSHPTPPRAPFPCIDRIEVAQVRAALAAARLSRDPESAAENRATAPPQA